MGVPWRVTVPQRRAVPASFDVFGKRLTQAARKGATNAAAIDDVLADEQKAQARESTFRAKTLGTDDSRHLLRDRTLAGPFSCRHTTHSRLSRARNVMTDMPRKAAKPTCPWSAEFLLLMANKRDARPANGWVDAPREYFHNLGAPGARFKQNRGRFDHFAGGQGRE